MNTWKYDDRILTLTYSKGQVFWKMPEDWDYKGTHPDLFKLVEYILLSPWDTSIIKDWKWSRTQGFNTGLSFSGGVDSTAAMILLPVDTKLVYHERYPNLGGQLNQDNALNFIYSLSKEVYIIPSNHEIIRSTFIESQRPGFSTDYACGTGVILLADYLKLGYFATGMVLESAYLYSGYKFRDFNISDYWIKWSNLFRNAGLELFQPVAGCSEVITTWIVNCSRWKNYAQSCLRGSNNQGCGKCYKCFRKGLLLGQKVEASDEVLNIISKTPLKMGSSLIYGLQRVYYNVTNLDKININYKDIDVSWLENHYPPSIDLMPEKYRSLIVHNLNKYSSPMNSPYMIEGFNI